MPIPKIIGRYSRSIANCAAAASFADRAYIYDNSVDGDDPKLLFRTVDGEIVKVYRTIHDWAKVIVDTLPRGREPSPDDERKHAADQLSP